MKGTNLLSLSYRTLFDGMPRNAWKFGKSQGFMKKDFGGACRRKKGID
ncbi:hypothetical protein [Caenibacillus caldisaponilyticus]|nr:hypothetical protein [Caenibacillus caldisaponilyticus]